MHSTMVNAIEISHLRRTFISSIGVIKRTTREIVAVEDVSFDIQEGELFGLLGPNGAGKTTTTKMLTTLLIPTSGSASVKGFDVVTHADAVRRRIGCLLEDQIDQGLADEEQGRGAGDECEPDDGDGRTREHTRHFALARPR